MQCCDKMETISNLNPRFYNLVTTGDKVVTIDDHNLVTRLSQPCHSLVGMALGMGIYILPLTPNVVNRGGWRIIRNASTSGSAPVANWCRGLLTSYHSWYCIIVSSLIFTSRHS